jgi:hypothetical protein
MTSRAGGSVAVQCALWPIAVVACLSACGAAGAEHDASQASASDARTARRWAELTAELFDGVIRAAPHCATMEAFVRRHQAATEDERSRLANQTRTRGRPYDDAQTREFHRLVTPKVRPFLGALRLCHKWPGLRAALALIEHPARPRACESEPPLVESTGAARTRSGVPIVAQRIVESRRIGGTAAIQPDFPDAMAIAKYGLGVVGIVDLCVDVGGHVMQTALAKATCYPGYDAKLEAGVHEWVYRPLLLDGKPTPFCTSATFIYRPR